MDNDEILRNPFQFRDTNTQFRQFINFKSELYTLTHHKTKNMFLVYMQSLKKKKNRKLFRDLL